MSLRDFSFSYLISKVRAVDRLTVDNEIMKTVILDLRLLAAFCGYGEIKAMPTNASCSVLFEWEGFPYST